MASSWMECARWSAKYTIMARLANNNAIAPLTANLGNSSVRPPADTRSAYRPATEYAKVATKVLSTTWVGRSRRKLRNNRGENCVDDSCSATTVRPSTNAITVTTVLVTLLSKVRASSAVPRNASGDPGPTGIRDRTNPAATASTALIPGNTHSDPVTYSRSVSRLLISPAPTAPTGYTSSAGATGSWGAGREAGAACS